MFNCFKRTSLLALAVIGATSFAANAEYVGMGGAYGRTAAVNSFMNQTTRAADGAVIRSSSDRDSEVWTSFSAHEGDMSDKGGWGKAEWDRDTLTIGYDFRTARFANSIQADFSKGRFGSTDAISKSKDVSIFGSSTMTDFVLPIDITMTAGIQAADVDTWRAVEVYDETADEFSTAVVRGTHDDWSAVIRTEVGLELSDEVRVFAALGGVYNNQGTVKETYVEGASVFAKSDGNFTSYMELGADYAFDVKGYDVKVGAAYQTLLRGRNLHYVAAYHDDLEDKFDARTPRLDKDRFQLKAQVEKSLTDSVSVFGRVDAQFASKNDILGGEVGVVIKI